MKTLFVIRGISWLLLGLLTLELCARLEDKIRYQAPFWSNYDVESLYEFDALGYRGRPNASYLKWKFNELGYRGPAMREGTYRIACVGASETFGEFESPEHEWPRRLEAILNSREGTTKYEVINTAYPGMSIPESYVHLPEIISRVRPKLVIVYPSYTHYIGRTKRSIYVPSKAPKEQFRLRMTERIHDLLKQSLPAGIQNEIRTFQIHAAKNDAASMDRLPDASVALFEQDMDNLTTYIQQAGVDVMLVTHATRFGDKLTPDDRQYLTSWRKFYPSLKEEGFVDMEQRMGDAVRRVAAKHGVTLVDAAREVEPGAKNFAEFVHFTDAGADSLASTIAEHIPTSSERDQKSLLVQRSSYSLSDSQASNQRR